MAMRLLLVDDEKVMRESLKAMIDWKQLGYEWFEAADGLKAIQILEENNIELVLLDVTMPLVNGFGVLDWMKENHYDCVVSLLTCHDEFEYVKKAIQYNCFDYVMKDELDRTKILELIDSMKAQLSQEKLKESMNREAKLLKQEKIKENFQEQIRFLLTSEDAVPAEFAKTFTAYRELDVSKYRFVSVFMDIQSYLQVIDRYTEKNVVQFSNILDGIFQELLEDKDYFYCEMDHGECYILMWFRHHMTISDIIMNMQMITEKIYSSFYHVLGMDISILYSLPYANLDECNQYYHRMEKCRKREFVESLSGIHCIDDYQISPKESVGFYENFEKSLLQAIESRNKSKIEMVFDRSEQDLKDNQIIIDPKDFIDCCLKHCRSAGIDQQSAADLQNCSTYLQVKNRMLEMFAPICIEENSQDKNLAVSTLNENVT